MVVIREIFLYKNSLSFIQAGNPLYSLCMIYTYYGPVLGEELNDSLDQDSNFSTIWVSIRCFLLMTMPQYYAWRIFDARMLNNQEIPRVLFDEGFLVDDEDHLFFKQFTFTVFAIAAIVFISKGYAKSHDE